MPAITLTFDLLTQNLISKSIKPSTSVTKIGSNSVHWFLRLCCSQGFRDAQMHALTHSFTDGQTRIQYASSNVFQWWRGHILFLPSSTSVWN